MSSAGFSKFLRVYELKHLKELFQTNWIRGLLRKLEQNGRISQKQTESIWSDDAEKTDFLNGMSLIFQEENLEILMSAIPDEFAVAVEYLCWNNDIAAKTLRNLIYEKLNREISILDLGILVSSELAALYVKNHYFYFPTDLNDNSMIGCPRPIKLLFRKAFPRPTDKTLNYLASSPSNNFYFHAADVLDETETFWPFFDQKLYEVTSKRQLKKTSLKLLSKIARLKEFYPRKSDSRISELRSSLFFSSVFYFAEWKGQISDPEVTPPEQLKKLFQYLTQDFDILSFNFEDLKKKPNIEYVSDYKNALSEISQSVSQLTPHQWVNFENFIESFKADFWLNDYSYLNYYFSQSYYQSKITGQKISPNDMDSMIDVGDDLIFGEGDIQQLREIIIPIWKGCIFLLASFGIVEIAYDYPPSSFFFDHQDFLTRYDGLKSLKLTSLGAFVLGREQVFDYEKEASQQFIENSLDENYLWIRFDPRNTIAEIALKDFGEKISNNKIRVTAEFFLKGVNSLEDFEKKKERFSQLIEAPFPQIWKNFFEDLENRFSPILPEPNLEIFRLRNDQIKQLWLRDPILRENSLRVEKSRVAIKTESVEIIMQRLKSLGFFPQ